MSSKVRLAQHDGHVFVVFVAMTPRQVQIVQQTFKLLAPQASEATDIFYSELFRIAPETRRLFPNDMSDHKGKFVQMLATVVKCLDNVSEISDHIADLGRRHAGYDVRESDYDLVGHALLSMLHRLLGARCTPEIGQAWAAAYGMLARLMKEAAAEPHPASTYFNSVVHGGLTAQYGISSETEFDAQEKKHGVTQPHSPMRRARHP
jgi:hemoglobin-like flavoprotein